MNLTLHSQRLLLTPYSANDVDLSIELFTDPAVVKYALGIMSEAEIKKGMADWSKRGGNGCIGIWTVSDLRTGEKYGSVALLPMPIDQHDTDYSLVVPDVMPEGDVEIGFFLKRTAWGQGYATEAANRILQYAFQDSPLKEVVATFDKNNLASRKVLEKTGFSDCGTMPCYGDVGLNFRITRDEWLKQQST